MSTSAVMKLLQRKVPLTLLLDLADADRMPSRVILRRESGNASWLSPSSASTHSSLACWGERVFDGRVDRERLVQAHDRERAVDPLV